MRIQLKWPGWRWALPVLIVCLMLSAGYFFFVRPAVSVEEAAEEAVPPPIPNPFTGGGALTDSDTMPFAVSIDNLGPARPQTGIESASLVYELPVEGGITRFLAFFLDENIAAAGPVRSVRPYFIDLAEEYHSVLVHCGGSPEALQRLAAPGARHINQIESPKGFRRSPDRKAPHNLYAELPALRKFAKELFSTVPSQEIRMPWFWGSPTVQDLPPAADIHISYWTNYVVDYHYQPDTLKYIRLVNGKPHTSSNSALSADHVVVQFVEVEVLDSKGRLQVGAKDAQSGRMVAFTRGRVIEGTWTHEEGQTTFVGPNQQQLALDSGLVWVQMVPLKRSVSWK